jgi:diacylglycerol O-acyltransferase
MLEMADGAGAEGFTDADHGHHGRLRRLVPGPVAAAASGTLAAASGARSVAGRLAHEGMETLAHPGHLAELAADATHDARTLAKFLIGPGEAKTALRGALGVAHRVAWSDPLDLDRVKAVGKRARATVNDVLVATLAGALRRFLDARDEDADEMHAFVPFNLRPLDQPIPRELGNRFGLVLLGLPVGEGDPGARLRARTKAMDEITHSPEGPLSYGVLEALGLVPPAVEARVVDLYTSRASMVLTNVPGPRERLSLAGRPIRRVLVWAPCSGSVGMSVSIFSYAGEVTVGLMVDAGLVPEPVEITGAIGDELDSLERAVAGAAGARSGPPRSS